MTLGIDEILRRLDGVRRSGAGHVARCPGHDDRQQSLSVTQMDDGIRFKCFTGCDRARILEAMGLTLSDILPPREALPASKEKTWELRDEAGELVAVHRRVDKPGGKMVWWEKDGTKGLKGLPVEDLPLYGAELAPELNEAQWVFVCEGEKATDAARAIGVQALGTATGASTAPRAPALAVLRGLKVALWPDNDDAGRKHMGKVAQGLAGVAIQVVTVAPDGLPPKGDAVEWTQAQRKAGRSREEMRAALVELADAAGAAPAPAAPEETGPKAVFKCLADVQPEAVKWLWYPRIPRGKITMLDGDPGLGKTAMLLDLAARLSAGRAFPEAAEAPEPAGVIIMTAEDGLGDTIRPRLEAAGADLSRVVALTDIDDGREHRPPAFPGDVGPLEQLIRATGAALVIIDPLMAYLDSKLDSHKDQDIRRALSPLARLAESTGAALVIIRHLNKAKGGPAIYRGAGSMGISGAARAALMVASDPDASEDDNARVLALYKANLAPKSTPVLRFSVGGAPSGAAVITWNGVSALRPDAVLDEPGGAEDSRSKVDEAAGFLRQLLSGGPVSAEEVMRQAEAAGLSEKTMYRAKGLLRIKPEQSGRKWYWALPQPH